jgi:hypothetical protein
MSPREFGVGSGTGSRARIIAWPIFAVKQIATSRSQCYTRERAHGYLPERGAKDTFLIEGSWLRVGDHRALISSLFSSPLAARGSRICESCGPARRDLPFVDAVIATPNWGSDGANRPVDACWVLGGLRLVFPTGCTGCVALGDLPAAENCLL